jgi:hypothetical protein
VVEITANVPGFRMLPVTCETCGRATMALCTVPDASSMMSEVGLASGKCTHCSRPLDEGGAIVSLGPDFFHRACAHVVTARDRVRTGRALSRQSRERLERARAQLDCPRPED